MMLINTFLPAVTLDIAGEAQKQGLYGSNLVSRSDAGFGTWLSNILQVVMVIGTIACLGFLILGAIGWITSGGDKNKVEQARDRITNAVIGLILLAVTLAIFNILAGFLGIDNIKIN